MQKKYIISIFFSIILISLSASSVYALEINYNIPGLNPITADSGLGDYVKYYFGLAVIVAGFLALVFLAVGSVGLIASAGNPEARSNAISRIRSSILGLILVLSSFILIKSINPQLIGVSLTQPESTVGLYYEYGGGNFKPAPTEESNIPSGAGALVYKCLGKDSPQLRVLWYSIPGFAGCANGSAQTLDCNGRMPFKNNKGSYKTYPITPGVNFRFSSGSCETTSPIIGDQKIELSGFLGLQGAQGFWITNDEKNNTFYGVIGHQDVDLNKGSLCSPPYIKTKGGQAMPSNFPFKVFSANVFKWDPNIKSAGDGIDFYSEAFGWDTGTKERGEGSYFVTSDQMAKKISERNPALIISAKDISFDYKDVNVPEGYAQSCKTFADCPGSIRIKGSYIVIVTAGDTVRDADGGESTAIYCRTFNKDVSNLKATDITGLKNIKINKIYIIPTLSR